ncbi:sce7726 family protein [Flagellimonas marinaquae]|nr:sce7726 family protein [Allomuricauda aquimarina]
MNTFEENQVFSIARFFSPSVVKELARKGHSPLLSRLIRESSLVGHNSENLLLFELFEQAFSILKSRQHRNEYIYKAALTNKILLGIHSLNTASMLTEFRTGKCIADTVILNGTGTVYEIKSERDNLSKLRNQIDEYLKVFAKVNVIIGENHFKNAVNILPHEVGISVLTSRHQISTLREGIEAPERTVPEAIFDAIQLREAKMILRSLGLNVPEVPNTQSYKVLKEIFVKLPSQEAHNGMVEVLKKTRNLVSLKSLMENLPPSLQAAVLSTTIRKRDFNKLVDAVNTPLNEALMWD